MLNAYNGMQGLTGDHTVHSFRKQILYSTIYVYETHTGMQLQLILFVFGTANSRVSDEVESNSK